MWEHRNKTAIASVGYSPLLRRTDRTLSSLALDAFDAALDDAGLTRDQIDGLSTYPDMPRYGGEKGGADGIDIITTKMGAELLGVSSTVKWQAEQGAAPRSLINATEALLAGECTYALVWRAVHVPEGRFNDYDEARARRVLAIPRAVRFSRCRPPGWRWRWRATWRSPAARARASRG